MVDTRKRYQKLIVGRAFAAQAANALNADGRMHASVHQNRDGFFVLTAIPVSPSKRARGHLRRVRRRREV
jgi:hypothetical protein